MSPTTKLDRSRTKFTKKRAKVKARLMSILLKLIIENTFRRRFFACAPVVNSYLTVFAVSFLDVSIFVVIFLNFYYFVMLCFVILTCFVL